MSEHTRNSTNPALHKDIPYQLGAPWPAFRRTLRNTGASTSPAVYKGDCPWLFQTGKGIFSTPVIDADGVIYVGSADHNFYAIRPDGTERWRVRTGEVIDSAAALPADQPGTVLVPSGDGYLYRLDTSDGRELWRFDARIAPRASYNNWFEANVVAGPDGTIYAGNTNFNYYAVTPEGRLKWTYETGANCWSAAAFGDDGTLYWGSCDTCFHAVTPEGKRKWKRRTLGFVAASAAVGLDGTVYIGSFDSTFYALNPHSGKARWKFRTGDHIYGSAALLEDEERTQAIFVGSTDGILYALSPQGKVIWQYDTGAPIRSSPVIGRAPGEEDGHIVYFGNGDGKLYALNAKSGERRWSYDTTGAGDAPPDRNDLNGSPALGENGVLIGGEHGQLWYVPYDYPLHQPEDVRGCTDPAEHLPASSSTLYYMTPGGRAQPQMPPALPAACLICLKLVIREVGATLPARLPGRRNRLEIAFDPPVPFRWELSGDGRYLAIIPDDFLATGRRYTLSVKGSYLLGGLHVGNLTVGGRTAGRFEAQFTFGVEDSDAGQLPLRIDKDQVTAFEWTRLSVPIPTMLTSLNQIGFDYMHWLIAPVKIDPPDSQGRGSATLWAVGAKRNRAGELVVDRQTDFRLPLSGRYQGDAFILSNRDFRLAITGIPIPFHLFQIRGRLGKDLRILPGASAFAETEVLSIPTYGIPMVIAGLANRIWRQLVALGTYLTRPIPADSAANKRPAGVSVDAVRLRPAGPLTDGRVTVKLSVREDCSYPAEEHLASILLVNRKNGEVIPLDYHDLLRQGSNRAGNLDEIELLLPRGTWLPRPVSAIIILDAFPLYEEELDE